MYFYNLLVGRISRVSEEASKANDDVAKKIFCCDRILRFLTTRAKKNGESKLVQSETASKMKFPRAEVGIENVN